VAKIGDIVIRNYAGIDRRYTVRSFVPNASGTRDADCVAKFQIRGTFTHTHAFQQMESHLNIQSSPVFTPGQPVKVGDRRGTVIVDGLEDTVPVHLEAEERLTADGSTKINIDAVDQDVPRWLLVLDNLLP
jgi:hypothetical protein